MRLRRTGLLSETIDSLPLPVRWLVRVLAAVRAIVRPLLFVMAVAGAVGVVIGCVTLNAKLAAGALAQSLLAGFVLVGSFGSESIVIEAGRCEAAYVIRVSLGRRWREARGLRVVPALLHGDRAWLVRVRVRRDDPFGIVVYEERADTERAARAAAKGIEQRIRAGETFDASEAAIG